MANFSVEWLSQSYYKEQTPEKTPHSELQDYEGSQSARDCRASSPNNSCGYTSGSESEVGDDSEGESGQQRRVRTKFTSEQVRKLENTFNKHKYLGATQRRRIAEKLSLSETQVKTWFQNRRMKLKREVQEVRPEFLSVPAALLPPVLFQHHVLGGQLHDPSAYYAHAQQPLHRPVLPAPLHHHHRALPVILPPAYY
ncbi:ventral expressed homeobox [Synchiropus splendidus]|uniref:ventral expressed homeobox n=1 Tax=Synchiropus splendidus TaxID=270530 RepID=UPI00237D92A6|nr:ventral expressed homeobox [Synchiropus splendidus]